MLSSVGTALSVFECLEEAEKDNPGEIYDSNNYCGGSLGGCVQGLDNADKEGLHSCWRIMLFLVGRQLVSHPKVDLPHAVVLGVVVPH